VSELYTAFQSGVIDAVAIHDAAARMLKLDELMKFRRHADLLVYSAEYCINRAAWQKIPAELKRVFYHWMQLASQAEAQIYFDVEAGDARKTMLERGARFNTLTAEERARWQKSLAPVVDKFIETHAANGLPVRELIEAIRAEQRKVAAMTPDLVTRMFLDKPLPGLIDFSDLD
jgi:TRAP-type C4-dicarboxylate transport system substrate-binding protein